MDKIILFGIPVYTNTGLKDKLKSLLKQKSSPLSQESLIKLIDFGTIVPVINEPSKLKQIIMKIRAKEPLTDFWGVLTSQGLIYIIFSEGIKDQRVIDTVYHECIHLAHIQFPKQFGMINASLYVKFYTYFYQELFEARSYDKKLFAQFLQDISQIGSFTHWSTFNDSLHGAFRPYSDLPQEQFDARVIMIENIISYFNSGRASMVPKYNIVLALIRKTYRQLFKDMDYQSGVGQELWAPDEIVSILSTIKPNHPNVVKSLKLIKPGKKPVIKKDLKRRVIK